MHTTRPAAIAAVALFLTGSPAEAVEPADLLRMSRCELEALYRAADAGSVPVGCTRGVAITRPGTRTTVPVSRIIHLIWQGKVFPVDGTIVNRNLGRPVVGAVSVGDSWLDGQPSVVIDYAGASRPFRAYRDEQREVSPGVYLGVTFVRKSTGPEVVLFYALDARPGR